METFKFSTSEVNTSEVDRRRNETFKSPDHIESPFILNSAQQEFPIKVFTQDDFVRRPLAEHRRILAERCVKVIRPPGSDVVQVSSLNLNKLELRQALGTAFFSVDM